MHIGIKNNYSISAHVYEFILAVNGKCVNSKWDIIKLHSTNSRKFKQFIFTYLLMKDQLNIINTNYRAWWCSGLLNALAIRRYWVRSCSTRSGLTRTAILSGSANWYQLWLGLMDPCLRFDPLLGQQNTSCVLKIDVALSNFEYISKCKFVPLFR